jgi:hypothetical protein
MEKNFQGRDRLLCDKGCHRMSRTTDSRPYGQPLGLSTCVENPWVSPRSLNQNLPGMSNLMIDQALLKFAPGKEQQDSFMKDGETIRKRLRSFNDDDEAESSYRPTLDMQLQVQEEGLFVRREAMTIYLLFEVFPVWLICLDKLNCKKLVVIGHSSQDSLLIHVKGLGYVTEFLQNMLEHINTFCTIGYHLTFSSVTVTRPSLMLVSSATPQQLICATASLPTKQFIGVVETHFSGRLRNGHPSWTIPGGISQVHGHDAVWYRVRHSSVGGATEFVTLFYSSGMSLDPNMSPLRRTIRHFVDFGIRATRGTEAPSTAAQGRGTTLRYSLGDRLRPGCYDHPIVCPSSFHGTGWGIRQLTLQELSNVHGISQCLTGSAFTIQDCKWPPAQSLDSMFLPAWTMLGSCEHTVAPTVDTIVVPPVVTTNKTWIPQVGRYLSHSWIDPELITATTRKNDNAATPCHLWDMRLDLLYPGVKVYLPFLRTKLLLRFRHRLLREARAYLVSQFGFAWAADLCLGRQQTVKGRQQRQWGGGDVASRVEVLLLEASKCAEVIAKICGGSWWEWDAGSALIFWRWGENKELARDGLVPYIVGALPTQKRKSHPAKNLDMQMVANKLDSIITRKYIAPGFVANLTDFFAVPKGDDIRLVYNGTSCGLNESIWAPNFWLPYPRSAIQLLDFGYYSVDLDLGEMFLNFPLHESLQAYSGIDLTMYQEKLGFSKCSKTKWYRWTRNWMGSRLSPFSSVQFCYLAEEFARGNNLDKSNALRWDTVILNLPGSPEYDPSKPRVYKWDREVMKMAGELIFFVDDGRASGHSVEHAWAIARQVTSRFQYKGIQDASRKRKPPTQHPGAWAGAVFSSSSTAITKTVTKEKWMKAKNIVDNLLKLLNADKDLSRVSLVYKDLEIARGFLGHLSMTFEIMVPYLKGFHLTLASHLKQRDGDGWKLTDKAWRLYVYQLLAEGKVGETEAGEMIDNANTNKGIMETTPMVIKPLQQLVDDVEALSEFLEEDEPPVMNDRSAVVQIVRYGFGDASGTGFGSTIQTDEGLKYRIGVWGKDEEDESSNFKELANVVSTITQEAEKGNLRNSMLYFFTDNTTVEAALHKGNSKSRRLFKLVVAFRKLQFKYGLHVVVSHVSGKRMIAQGTDGISRGSLKEGVGSGKDMLDFIPLHLSALVRHKGLAEWLKSWVGSDIEFLTPEGWYERGHDHDGGERDTSGFWRVKIRPGVFVWAPPPAAAEVAIEQLRRAVIKRQKSTHVFVCPRLLTPEWSKQLYKAADLVVSLPAGVTPGWPGDMLEPLTLGFVFPFLSCKPWRRKGTPKMLHLARAMPGMWSKENMDAGYFLREFFQGQRQLTHMSECVVRKVLYFE